MTTSPLAIRPSRASPQACATAATPSSGTPAENLHELAIAIGVVLEARWIADIKGVGT